MSNHVHLAAVALLLIAATSIGCEDEPPPPPHEDSDLPALEWEGDRVVVGTDVVDEVCVGTLEHLDVILESIEAGLGLPPSENPIEFFVLETEMVESRCGSGVKACTDWPGATIYVAKSKFDQSAAHELVHARLFQGGRGGGKPLFVEGIASAFEADGDCLASQTCATSALDDLLLADTSAQLSELGVLDGYTAGADLVHGMLAAYGAQAVLAFMDELAADTPPDEVRALYLERFGAALDDDFQAFVRGPFDDYTIAQRGCEGLVPAPRTDKGGVEISGSMDCSSPNVVNNFNNPLNAWITWTFSVTPEQSGTFVVGLSDASEYVHLLGCRPPDFEWNDFADSGPYTRGWSHSHDFDFVTLEPGQYKVQWLAEFGSSVDFELVPPCSFETGGCADGQQCTIWNECQAGVAAPTALGEACEQGEGAPLVCEAGARCLGGVCVAECDATRGCEGGQSCTRTRVCGPVCDLLAQNCEPGLSCQPSLQAQLHANGLGVCVAAGEGGLFETCDRRGSECQAGLSCERLSPLPCTYDSSENGGCCIPLCDPGAAVSDCPAKASVCDPIRDGPVGVCREPYWMSD